MPVIKSKYLNIDNIKFSKPNYYSKGGGSIALFQDNSLLEIQTPKLASIFGLSCYKDDEKDDKIKSITITLQFNSKADDTNRVDNFLKKIKKLDNKIKSEASKQHKSWLKCSKPVPNEAINALFKKSLYYKTLPTTEIDYSVPPTFKVKIPYYNDKIGDLNVFNQNNESVDFDLEYLQDKIVDGCVVKAIIQPKIWIIDKKFGITYNLKALQIFEGSLLKQKKTNNNNNNNKSINLYFNNQNSNNKSDDSDSDSDDDDIEQFNH